jgi:hypothetical protein
MEIPQDIATPIEKYRSLKKAIESGVEVIRPLLKYMSPTFR